MILGLTRIEPVQARVHLDRSVYHEVVEEGTYFAEKALSAVKPYCRIPMAEEKQWRKSTPIRGLFSL